MALKIYTKTGDDGTTALWNGQRVPKHHLRIEVLGALDELNAFLGIVRSLNPPSDVDTILSALQNHIFIAGSDIAIPAANTTIPHIQLVHIEMLERWIDTLDATLPPLQAFILPEGSIIATHIHAARAVCRRAERLISHLASHEPLNHLLLMYFNRCSDLLFVLARKANQLENVQEQLWKGREIQE